MVVCMLAINHPLTPKSLHLCLEWTVDGEIEWLQYASYPPSVIAMSVFVLFINLHTSSAECALNESNTSRRLLQQTVRHTFRHFQLIIHLSCYSFIVIEISIQLHMFQKLLK